MHASHNVSVQCGERLQYGRRLWAGSPVDLSVTAAMHLLIPARVGIVNNSRHRIVRTPIIFSTCLAKVSTFAQTVLVGFFLTVGKPFDRADGELQTVVWIDYTICLRWPGYMSRCNTNREDSECKNGGFHDEISNRMLADQAACYK